LISPTFAIIMDISHKSVIEEDIDGLLDSALKDFDNAKKKEENSNVEQNIINLLDKVSVNESQDAVKSEIANLPKIITNNCDSRVFTTIQNTNLDPSSSSCSLQDALSQLSRDAEELKQLPSDEEVNKLLSGIATDNLEQGLGSLLPMMEGMMQSLLSKDLLYPAMKDMNAKFPDWLADNRCRLSESDYAKYNKQFDLTQKICLEFEQESDRSSETEVKDRYNRVMQHMQAMQELGQPPKEIVGEADLQMASGNSPIPGSPDVCCIS